MRSSAASMAKRFSISRSSSQAQENADEYGNEVEQLRGTIARCEEEKQRLEAELQQVKEMLQREVSRADAEGRRSSVIIAEYKQICQRLEDDNNTAKASLGDLRTKISKCDKCFNNLRETSSESASSVSAAIASPPNPLDSRTDPILSRAQERVRELELELAQTKLAHVEAECRNQDLTHQLHATAAELQAARNSWPWLSKTLSSIKEAANKREMVGGGGGGGNNNASVLRRDSAPPEMRHTLSRDNFKEAV